MRRERNKYSARRRVYNGIRFASTREMRRYKELLWLERAGEISNLETQPRYEIIPLQRRADGSAERAAHYTADFRYIDKQGNEVIEDVKSKVTAKLADYVLRRKLMLHVYGIEVKEVL